MYEEEKYNENSGPLAGVKYFWGEDYCLNDFGNFNNIASSLRYSGAPNGYQ